LNGDTANEGAAARVDAWVRAHGARLYRSAFYLSGDRHDAEELCQEAFAVALEGDFRGESAPYTYLYGILKNLLRSRRRKRRPTTAAELPEDARPRVPPGEPPPALAEAAEAAALVREEVLALPEEQRDVVLLHYLEGAPVEEIAAALEIPAGTVKSRLFTARGRLRERLGRAGLGDERHDGEDGDGRR
jgi:RNA polymerase sigma-70 factor (ECF subfamily)